MKSVLCVPILLVVFAACKKDPKQSPNVQPTSDIKFPTAKMNGDLIWMGHAFQTGNAPGPPESFIQYNFTVVNDTTVEVDSHILFYTAYDTANHIVQYKDGYSFFHLYFNTIDNSLEYGWQNANTGATLNTKSYKSNSSLKNYLPDITGTKMFSGTVYDTLSSRTPIDSSYTISAVINVTAGNDSTIVVDKDFLNLNGKTLHYKQTNESEKTIVFQSFCLNFFSITTLTYNYDTKSLVYEQQFRSSPGWWRYLKMQ